MFDRTHPPPDVARQLFAPIASSYERWARVLSMGQDARWRETLISELGLPPGSRVLDVAAGTGSITRALQAEGHSVVSVDQSAEMIRLAESRGATAVLATAERLPFEDESFDAVTFGYLLRYVSDVQACLEELVRVVRPGGAIGMIEFGRPTGVWSPLWWLYTRLVLRGAGAVIRSGWLEVGRFLGPSIGDFARAYPPDRLVAVWRESGLSEVKVRRLSLGGGLVLVGRRS
jgi:demethylmenaquinone methyltransferase/2-methoxy-6-polyprenyl-1,4-benzoquinol methylase